MSSTMLHFRPAPSVPFAVALLTSMLAFSSAAQAQGVDEFGSYGPPVTSSDRQSAQSFTLELRVGPYLPQVDNEFGGNGPFTDYFGTKHRVALGLELDWLPLVVRDILRFGPGFGFMYTSIGADAFRYQDHARMPGQRTSLRTLPHWVAGVLRVDALARKTPIPLVFAAKAGLAHALWWTSDKPRNSPAEDGSMGRDRSYGYYYGIGAYFDATFIDTISRKRTDAFLGINRIYFFGEFYGLELDGFGSGNVMDLTDRSWVLGLAFDI